MLAEMVREVRERDPDVIEGHNFRFDLNISRRGQAQSRARALGRDGSPLKSQLSRTQIAERTIGYRKYEILRRHIITWLLAQHYDVTAREPRDKGLKDIARHFGIAGADDLYSGRQDELVLGSRSRHFYSVMP
jgi:hypothetical protein